MTHHFMILIDLEWEKIILPSEEGTLAMVEDRTLAIDIRQRLKMLRFYGTNVMRIY